MLAGLLAQITATLTGISLALGGTPAITATPVTNTPQPSTPAPAPKPTEPSTRSVPFYSQFADISDPAWQPLGCGIASVAMLIDYYGETESVDSLLERGIDSGAFLTNAGWTHAGLIALTKPYGLAGESVGLSGLSPDAAFARLAAVVKERPVMVSIYYTFTPGNPIPHLVVINDIKDGVVYYNDPADPKGNGTISIEKFKPAWKQRYIDIHPVS